MSVVPANRIGRILAMVGVLVAVILAARFGYTALGSMQADTGEGPSQEAQAPDATEPQEAPGLALLADYDATVYTEDRQALKLTQIADGKPLVINFWATWCPYCIEEMPGFAEVYAEYADRVNFAFVDAVDGRRETVEMGAAWMADNGFDLPVYYDIDAEAVYSLGITAFPTTLLISAEGEIVAYGTGMIDPDSLRSAIEKAL